MIYVVAGCPQRRDVCVRVRVRMWVRVWVCVCVCMHVCVCLCCRGLPAPDTCVCLCMCVCVCVCVAHVILTRQTCGQHLSKAAESKRQALEHFFFERIYYMFLIPKCRGYWDLSLRTTSGLAFGESQRNGQIRFFLRQNTFFFRSRNCAAVLQTQVPKLCANLDLKLLYILILGTCSKFARKNNFQALGVCFPQPCLSAGRRFAVSRSRLQYYQRIVLFPQQQFRWNTL